MKSGGIVSGVAAVLIVAMSSMGFVATAHAEDPASTPTETASPAESPTPSAEPTPEPAPPTGPGPEPSKSPSKSPTKPSKSPSPSPSPSSSDDKKKKKKKKDKDKDPNVPQATSWDEQGLEGVGVKGIDVSLWQHTADEVIDWKVVKKSGVRWVYSKCSDGPGTPGDYDHWGTVDVVGAQQVGLMAGCYHYGQPGMGSPDLHESARIQARVAVDRLPDEMQTRLPLALDIEETGDLSSKDIAEWTYTFLQEAEKLTGRTPWIYASSSFLLGHMPDEARLKRYPVWVAGWGVDRKATAPEVPAWTKLVAWQFTSVGVIDGVPNPIVDLSVFLRTEKKLKKYAPSLAKLEQLAPPPPTPVVLPTLRRADITARLVGPEPSCARDSLTAALSMGAVPHIAPQAAAMCG